MDDIPAYNECPFGMRLIESGVTSLIEVFESTSIKCDDFTQWLKENAITMTSRTLS